MSEQPSSNNPLRSFPVDDSDGMQRDAYWAADVDALIARLQSNLDAAIATAKRREERLWEIVKKYARHHDNCDWLKVYEPSCTCGRDSMIAGAPDETPAALPTWEQERYDTGTIEGMRRYIHEQLGFLGEDCPVEKLLRNARKKLMPSGKTAAETDAAPLVCTCVVDPETFIAYGDAQCLRHANGALGHRLLVAHQDPHCDPEDFAKLLDEVYALERRADKTEGGR
jgi:hypothetical protein